jgi:methylthioribose-1-phosphate isomerase
MNDGGDPVPYRSLSWQDGVLALLDQRRLPEETVYLRLDTVEALAEAVRTLAVRGAPAIGAAGAYGMVLAARPLGGDTAQAVVHRMREAARLLKSTRPTAVNLAWAVDRVLKAVESSVGDPVHLYGQALAAARAIEKADVRANRAMGQHGVAVIPRTGHVTIVHHCNTGALATVDYGTALGVIRAAHEAGRDIEVLVDETRPLLQGARLTMWELMQRRIPATLMVDGAAAHAMRTRGVDLCLVGADRIAANGDVANKIGTYQLAVAARAHGVPFYVAAPTSTIDPATPSGDAMEIEQRAADEVRVIGGRRMAPEGAPVLNPAFDVTPAALVTAIITEVGVLRPPYGDTLADAVRRAAEEA